MIGGGYIEKFGWKDEGKLDHCVQWMVKTYRKWNKLERDLEFKTKFEVAMLLTVMDRFERRLEHGETVPAVAGKLAFFSH